MKSPDLNRLLTVAEAAVVLGVSPHTVRYYDRIGRLVPQRLGPRRMRIYDLRAVKRFQVERQHAVTKDC